MRSPLIVLGRLGRDRAARLLILLAVSLAIFLSVGRMAFNITDEGFFLDLSYRIVHGAIPHRDLVTTVLQGSGLLHIIDLAVPTPVLATSRLIAITEWVAYSAILAAVTFAAPFRRWRPIHIGAVLAATVINLHTFPIMAWYTVDGILFCSVGIYLLMSAPRPLPMRRAAIAMLLFGGAFVIKLSFGPASLLGAVTIAILSFHEGWRRCLTKAVLGGLVSALPFAIYTAWVGLAGGSPT